MDKSLNDYTLRELLAVYSRHPHLIESNDGEEFRIRLNELLLKKAKGLIGNEALLLNWIEKVVEACPEILAGREEFQWIRKARLAAQGRSRDRKKSGASPRQYPFPLPKIPPVSEEERRLIQNEGEQFRPLAPIEWERAKEVGWHMQVGSLEDIQLSDDPSGPVGKEKALKVVAHMESRIRDTQKIDPRTIRRSNEQVGREGSWRPVIEPEFISDSNVESDDDRPQITNHQDAWDLRQMILKQSQTRGRKLSQDEEETLEKKFGAISKQFLKPSAMESLFSLVNVIRFTVSKDP